MCERNYLTPEDIRMAWINVAAHRVRLSPRGRAMGLTVEEILNDIFASVRVPKIS